MAVSIGTVYMDLRAASTHLRGDIKKAMGGAQKQFVAAGKDIAKVATVAIAGASAALVAATKKGLDAVDQLAKTSDRLGSATENLQAFRHAAELTGATANTLDMGLQRMTRRISEAAQGSGEAQNAIRELGLEATRLNSLSIDDQFLAISDAMQNVKNSADQVRLTQKLFDSEGVKLVNTLKLGREGLMAARKELDDFGVSISRIDAAKVERANDAFTRVRLILSGVSNLLAVELAPTLEVITNRFLNSAKAANGFGKQASVLSDRFVQAIGFAQNLGTVIEGIFRVASLAWSGMSQLIANFALIGEKAFYGLQATGGLVFEALKLSVVRWVEISISAIKKLNKSLIAVADFLPGVDGAGLKVAVDAAFSGVDQSLAKARNDAERGVARYWKGITNVSKRESSQFLLDWEKNAKTNIAEGFRNLSELVEGGLKGEDLAAEIFAQRELINDELKQLEADLQKPFEPIDVEIPVNFTLEKSLEGIKGAPAQALEAFRREFDLLSIELQEGVIGLDQFKNGIESMKRSVRDAEQVFRSTRTEAESYQAEIGDLNGLLDRGVITQETYSRAVEQAGRKYNLTQKPIKAVQKITEDYRKTIQKLRSDLDKGAISVDQFNESSLDAGKKFQESQEQIRKNVELVGRAWDTVGRNIGNAIDDIVDHGKFSFKGLVKSILADMAKLVLRQIMMRAMFSAFSTVTGFLGFGGAYADGGRPPKGVPSLVGEEGPELFIPDASGTIIPHMQTKSMLAGMSKRFESPAVSASPSVRSAGGNVTNQVNNKSVQITVEQTNHFESGVSGADVAQMLKEHGRQLVEGITDGIQRGGAFRQVFQS